MSDKIIRKHRFDKSSISGTIKDCQKLYNEIKQWTRCEKDDLSPLKSLVYGMGWTQGDLAYHGWEGEALKRESTALEAVMAACKYLENTLEDVLGIQSYEYEDYLKNDKCGRYKLVDTYKEN